MEPNPEQMSGTDEYRLLRAYCNKRKKSRSGPSSKSTAQHMSVACFASIKRSEIPLPTDGIDIVADKLTQIADHVPLVREYIEEDSSDCDDIIFKLVDILKESGDRLNEEIEKDRILVKTLQQSFTYSFFKKLTTAFIESVTVVRGPGKESSEKETEIAMTCEVTSRLTALDLQPMNRAMGFGAAYLKEHYSVWAKNQGGWENVLASEDEVE
ncbi:apoptosis facilitator Bcl-2-like protein 14 [Chanos chanos]|uniref:Apoptosis facilitator Bcl-2-like protein 14 n=1 Tax=Chanos chanos TaxID=29144 RepID=A0A6J2WKG1_CHACN|nr:apoptosis facilitator Bcl-2-like protein 14 [Chanos chanos]